MTMLDDHEMRDRLSGIAVAEVLVNVVPTTLLRHTGMGELIEKVSKFLLSPYQI
jgi:Iap family predicted aminopeptidase